MKNTVKALINTVKTLINTVKALINKGKLKNYIIAVAVIVITITNVVVAVATTYNLHKNMNSKAVNKKKELMISLRNSIDKTDKEFGLEDSTKDTTPKQIYKLMTFYLDSNELSVLKHKISSKNFDDKYSYGKYTDDSKKTTSVDKLYSVVYNLYNNGNLFRVYIDADLNFHCIKVTYKINKKNKIKINTHYESLDELAEDNLGDSNTNEYKTLEQFINNRIGYTNHITTYSSGNKNSSENRNTIYDKIKEQYDKKATLSNSEYKRLISNEYKSKSVYDNVDYNINKMFKTNDTYSKFYRFLANIDSKTDKIDSKAVLFRSDINSEKQNCILLIVKKDKDYGIAVMRINNSNKIEDINILKRIKQSKRLDK